MSRTSGQQDSPKQDLDYLLIQVDCSRLELGIRNELFMASRDRLKSGDVADALRKHVRDVLLNSQLKDIAKRRKSSLNIDNEDVGRMLQDMTRNQPMNEALTRILRQSFNLSDQRPGTSEKLDRKDPKRPISAVYFHTLFIRSRAAGIR